MIEEAAEPDSISRAPWRRATLAAVAILPVGGAVLLWTGVIGEVGYWRVVVVACVIVAVLSFRTTAFLFRQIDRWEVLVRSQQAALSSIVAIPAVRCAGCHVSAALVRGEADVEGRAGVFEGPPGWDIRNERPYCGDCLAREET